MKKIPGLNDLRIFEVAGRLQNFRQAGDELHLTHSAVSHRIKSLEDQLGLILFERQNGVQLTDVGRELHHTVSLSLTQLNEGIARITQHHVSKKKLVRLSVLPSFAAYWLLPRLHDFYQKYPEINLQIQASVDLAEIGERGVDIAIRFGKDIGKWSKLKVHIWLKEFYYIVAAPDRWQNIHWAAPQELLAHTLLQHINTQGAGSSWTHLFKRLNIDTAAECRSISFDDSNLVLQAAEHGHGIAFERHSLVADKIESGALRRLSDFGLKTEFYYYILSDLKSPADAAVLDVINWLNEAAADFTAKHDIQMAAIKWLDV
jgi:LysR family glycine cleavage system transcriptional activator